MHPKSRLGALYQIVVRKSVRPCSDKYLHALQSDHCVQIGQAERSKWPRGWSLHLTTVFRRLWGAVTFDRPFTDWHGFPCCPGTAPKSNKGFQQHPMCRNPLFSAVSPIFCPFPLYQISGLHFHILVNDQKPLLICIIPEDLFLRGNACALPFQFVITAQTHI